MMAERIEYRGFVITYDPPSIPTRAYDWRWEAEDYYGAGDDRIGCSASLYAAKADIDEWWADYENGDEQLRYETETA